MITNHSLTIGTLFTTCILAGAATAQEEGHDAWYADFDVAAAAAKEAGKDLLVDFTGSDWCGWCIKLDKEVFAHAEFLEAAQKNFVLVALDFPRGEEAKAKVPNPERNNELQGQHGVQGFPTVLLMTADGEVFGRTGYAAGGVEPYVASLQKMLTVGKANFIASKTIEADYDGAKASARTKILTGAIATLAEMEPGAAGVEAFGRVVKHGLEAKEKATQLAAVKALLASGQQDDATLTLADQLDPKNEAGLQDKIVLAKMRSVSDEATALAFMDALDGLIELGAKDAESFEEMLARATQWAFRPMNNKERAQGYAAQLREHAADASKYEQLFEAIK